MKLKTILYADYEKDLPQKDNWILGQADENSLIVYQAFNPAIANYASAQQKFGGSAYSFSNGKKISSRFVEYFFCPHFPLEISHSINNTPSFKRKLRTK